ncbi:hypothetical protein [Capnocytophaga catalasegens]|uniref:Lipocalin-like domain-containing protein n=1 Tax=Capnocytophaga catalasegens TaxID=1004260 RepID=A0AAV5AQM9_9FLAO|nr:hypothetical protein [Capnocytophaga catalasegens]GIZ14258.1 hypothetical protein RCZ03_02590 [Capnocytophaga catalasegens]GJM49601.1 hypothetical protein RCZ15_05760 [Capnocytophaga catalasegens]GJM52916.1 hypothetical protein RCZ16_12330 [Capnocytophaga catalasegens]
MKNILKLALVTVSMLVVSCGKNDDTPTENARILGTWKRVKTEDVKDGKRVNPRDVKDDDCSKYVFTNKTLTNYYPREEDNKCVTEEKPYRIKNGRIYYKEYNDEKGKYEDNDFQFNFIDDDTFEEIENNSNGADGRVDIYKCVK